jgi:heat-inducible transcriptional repressor
MSEDRRLAVLRAIVEDYVTTHEPVGSKALVERHSLGVSPATIRNDMAVLEEEGLIAQPHTSAGRVPTDQGYRLFVDRLSGVKPLSAAEKRAIHQFLDSAVDLDDIMVRTVRLLAQITKQVAMVQYPSLTKSSVRHVELVPLSTTRLMVVVIADTGRVEQRVVECPGHLDEAQVADLRAKLGAALGGQPFGQVPDLLTRLVEELPDEQRATLAVIHATLLDAVSEQVDERVMLGGTAHLARYGQEFPLSIQPVLEALEEQMVLMRLLGEATVQSGVTVRIGRENPIEGLSATSVVTSGYGRGDQQVASLGIVGPTHMDYAGTMGAVVAVAQYVGRILEEA